MKEGKTTKNTAKTKNTNNKSSVNQKNTKVKDVDFTPIEENFLDEKEDKRLIVFIALAILVIVGTIIGLLVGCQKKEQDEPKKPADVVEPKKDDKKKEDKKEERYDYEKPLPVVRKVATVSKKAKKAKKPTSSENVPTVSKTNYNISFIMGDTTEIVEVEDGSIITEYVPKGYTDCKYYTDEEMTQEFDFTTATASEDKHIYMSCTLVEYQVKYLLEDKEVVTTNPTSYTVESENVLLEDLVLTDNTFLGWFTDVEKTLLIEELSKDIVDLADENDIIYIYAGVTTGQDDVVDAPGETTNTESGEQVTGQTEVMGENGEGTTNPDQTQTQTVDVLNNQVETTETEETTTTDSTTQTGIVEEQNDQVETTETQETTTTDSTAQTETQTGVVEEENNQVETTETEETTTTDTTTQTETQTGVVEEKNNQVETTETEETTTTDLTTQTETQTEVVEEENNQVDTIEVKEKTTSDQPVTSETQETSNLTTENKKEETKESVELTEEQPQPVKQEEKTEPSEEVNSVEEKTE